MSLRALPVVPPPSEPERRLLILAPHCDDETLGLGGTIATARKRGVPVTLAFLTNGDGFRVAASRALKKPLLGPTDFVHFAELRQREALSAAKELGVPESDVVFLGFPDQGLLPLWQECWSDSHPLRSGFTAQTRSPYSVAQTPHVLYSGESLTRELSKLIVRVQPTDVYVTHPSDDHRDHSAAPNFARAALRRSGSDATLRYYLVHRGDWPLPQGSHPDDPLLPPSAMTKQETHWAAIPLDEEARAAKDRALTRYGSQMAVCERFLSSFVRRNELVCSLPEGGAGWHDPLSDNLARYTNPAADITGVSARRDGAALKLRLTLRGNASPRLRYVLHVRGRSDGRTLDHSALLTLRPTTLTGPTAEASVPLAALGLKPGEPGRAWVCAETFWTGQVALDRTGYREISF